MKIVSRLGMRARIAGIRCSAQKKKRRRGALFRDITLGWASSITGMHCGNLIGASAFRHAAASGYKSMPAGAQRDNALFLRLSRASIYRAHHQHIKKRMASETIKTAAKINNISKKIWHQRRALKPSALMAPKSGSSSIEKASKWRGMAYRARVWRVNERISAWVHRGASRRIVTST